MISAIRRSSLFFFSSRRRHTRCLSDWSSDVCSSDLKERGRRPLFELDEATPQGAKIKVVGLGGGGGNAISRMLEAQRSEERRVGKECRARGGADREKKKRTNKRKKSKESGR